MAEINIEEKKRSVLPWLLGAIAVAAVVWFLVAGRSPETTADRGEAFDTRSNAGTLDTTGDSVLRRNDTLTVPPPTVPPPQ